MIKTYFLLAGLLLITLISCKKSKTDTPEPSAFVKKQFEGSGDEYVSGVVKGTDGAYFLCGSAGNAGFATGYHALDDGFVIKADASGNPVWKKFYGTSLFDYFADLAIAADGNIIVLGSAGANDGDITGYNGGSRDGWIAKISSSNGSIIWSKVLGGTNSEAFSSVSLQTDGSIIAAGGYSSTTGTIPGNYGAQDAWVVKLDGSGNVLWNRNYGGTNGEFVSDLTIAANKIYVAGNTGSNNGDVSGNHGQTDAWVFSLDQNGNLLWQKAFGGTNNEVTEGVKILGDGNLLLSGYVRSNNGDATANYGGNDAWVIKSNSSNGAITWQKNYGGTLSDYIVEANPVWGVMVGYSKSNDNDLSGHKGGDDVWILKVNLNNGAIISSKLLGGELDDYVSTARVNGAKMIAGIGSNSSTGDFAPNTGYDIWLYEIE